MLPVMGFCGASGSGKTTLLCKVIEELKGRGYKVGVIKHHGHDGPVAEPAVALEKDTALMAQAGAHRVVLAHAAGVSIMAGEADSKAGPVNQALRFMSGLDIVLVEGYKRVKMAKVEVVAKGAGPVLPPKEVLAYVTPGGGSLAGAGENRVLNADDPVAVTDFVLASMIKRERPDREVSLVVNGRPLGMNRFVKETLEATLRAVVGTLKGGEGAETIEVKIG